tara:strand:+ start:2454 stop:3365 length:912 start_codon:yes stop_codon:yes gene_type:complete
MAKKVKGHRANKSNDSFGTINNDKLYRGKYREEVAKDDDEEAEELEAQEDTDEESATPQEATESSSSFAPRDEETPHEEADTEYKKRYDDLKRHYDGKLSEWRTEREELLSRLSAPTPTGNPGESTADLASFRVQYPDMYDAIEQISSSQSEARVRSLEQELNVIKEREQKLEKDRAYQELLRLQPDFDDLKASDEFRNWLKDQPSSISDGVYNNATDAKWAARVIDLYKADTGLNKKSTRSRKNKDAAMSVSTPAAKEVATVPGEKRIWKASEIGKMKPWEFEKVETELDAARAEGRIDYNS